MRRVACLVLVPTFAQLGCATVFQGQKQTVRITTEPVADVRRDGASIGATPIDYKVSRQHPSTLTLHQAGYEDAQVHFSRQADVGWFIWDIATCSIPITLCVPVILDAVTGSWFSYEEEYAVKLVPSPVPAPVAPTSAAR
jgi:hypothetical protein